MRKENKDQILNLSDTSFRRKEYSYAIPFCVRTMIKLQADNKTDKWDTASQIEYYVFLLHNSNIFSGRNEKDDPAKRARTNTNALVKLGLFKHNRVPSQVAHNWIDESASLKSPDNIEEILGLHSENLLYFRQLMKIRYYSVDKKKYIYPFRYVIKILSQQNELPHDIFSLLLYAADPIMNKATLDNLVNVAASYNPEASAEKELKRISQQINEIQTPYGIKQLQAETDVINLFNSPELAKNSFANCDSDFQHAFNETFFNRKTKKSVSSYFQFIGCLKRFMTNKSKQSYTELKAISRKDEVKRAFGAGSSPFIFSKRREQSIEQFINDNANNEYLKINTDPYSVYLKFINSKSLYLQNTYLDMNSRIMNLSGVLTNRQGQFGILYKDLWNILFASDAVSLNGEDGYKDYEESDESPLYQDITLQEILGLTDNETEQILDRLAQECSVSSITDLRNHFRLNQITRFRSIIRNRFDKETVIRILSAIDQHNSNSKVTAEKADEYVESVVTDATDIPTIFEYILNIAWYYLSGERTDPLNSMNLIYDGNMLPLTHASGGAGDIEVQQGEASIVMLEATLMNPSNQKKGELEPVIRHTANLAIDNTGKRVYTIFCANNVDTDVANIFRAMSIVELHHSSKPAKPPVPGVNILTLSISELIELLQSGDDIADIVLNSMQNFYENDKLHQSSWEWGNWREKRISEILQASRRHNNE